MSSMVIPCWRPLQWGLVGTCPLGHRTLEAFSEFGHEGPWVGVLQLDDHVTNVDNNNNNLYCALDTKRVKTYEGNDCEKKESTATQK